MLQMFVTHSAQYGQVDTRTSGDSTEARREKRKPTARRDVFLEKGGVSKTETLEELLNHLGSTFNLLKLPFENQSWIEKDMAIGLRKLGAHVPNPWLFHWYENPEDIRVDRSKKLPSMMCIAFLPKQADDENNESINSGFTFAIRIRKPPYFIRPVAGTDYYQFGHCYRVRNKNFWVRMFVSIDKEGKIFICDELRMDNTTITKKHRTRNDGGVRDVSFSNKHWTVPSLLIVDDQTVERRRHIETLTFLNTLEWWSKRDERWNVVVKKGGERVTFGIDQSLSKNYFADREMRISSVTGKPMKIVHYVNAHDRLLANGKVSHVREHIRGLREFDWKGYHCLVTAPEFTGKTSASARDVEAIMMDDDTSFDDYPGTIATSKFGQMLASMEEVDLRDKAASEAIRKQFIPRQQRASM